MVSLFQTQLCKGVWREMGPSELVWRSGYSLESVGAYRGLGQSSRSTNVRNGLGSHKRGSVAGEGAACRRDRKRPDGVELRSEPEGLKVQLGSLDFIQ